MKKKDIPEIRASIDETGLHTYVNGTGEDAIILIGALCNEMLESGCPEELLLTVVRAAPMFSEKFPENGCDIMKDMLKANPSMDFDEAIKAVMKGGADCG